MSLKGVIYSILKNAHWVASKLLQIPVHPFCIMTLVISSCSHEAGIERSVTLLGSVITVQFQVAGHCHMIWIPFLGGWHVYQNPHRIDYKDKHLFDLQLACVYQLHRLHNNVPKHLKYLFWPVHHLTCLQYLLPVIMVLKQNLGVQFNYLKHRTFNLE